MLFRSKGVLIGLRKSNMKAISGCKTYCDKRPLNYRDSGQVGAYCENDKVHKMKEAFASNLQFSRVFTPTKDT